MELRVVMLSGNRWARPSIAHEGVIYTRKLGPAFTISEMEDIGASLHFDVGAF